MSPIHKVVLYLLSQNATIFGAGVRDLLLQRYHEKIYKNKKYPDSEFYNSEYMPHLNKRMIVPTVIEFRLPCCNYLLEVHQKISELLGYAQHKAWTMFSGVGCCGYIGSYTDVFGNKISLIETSVIPTDVDFDCNGLILKSMEEVRLLPLLEFQGKDHNKIVDDIYHMTTSINNATLDEIQDMQESGWHVTERGIYEPPLYECVEEEKTCIICYYQIGVGEHVKRTCCNADYHSACMSKLLANFDTCPHCRDTIG